MDAEQKKRLIKRYVEEKSILFQSIELDDDKLDLFIALDDLLDYIGQNNQGLFDLTTLETDARQWKELVNIIHYAIDITSAYPQAPIKVNKQNADFGLQYWRNSRAIKMLPKDDYYARPTAMPSSLDEDLNQLIESSKEHLYALLNTPEQPSEFDVKDTESVAATIVTLNEIIANTKEALQKKRMHDLLNVLLDLNKINQLKPIVIRQNDGSSLNYCVLAEAIEGVTQKISLISVSQIQEQLGHLNAQSALTMERYNKERAHYQLNTDAIIKLPKHGNIIEVQHEAMALNISRMLNLDTTASTTIVHKGQPALFIPFATIRLLREFAKGKTFKAALGLTGKTYTHYSTIKPVGSGIEADHFTDDFGNALALLYLCSDPDAIGGYCQNKALRNSKSLFIFDQVFMDGDKFLLDSRLCLQPNQFLMQYTRHGLGRNKTLIEDSSMINKFDSIMRLKAQAGKLAQYASHVAFLHHKRAEAIKKELMSFINEEFYEKRNKELDEIERLEKDAELIKSKIQERINQIDEVLPKTKGTISSSEMCQCLIFEKLLHNPVLYSDDGRPYKNPWTEKHTNPIQSINELTQDTVQIHFKHKISLDMVQFIKHHGDGDSLSISTPKSICISKEQLHTLKESMLYPEYHMYLDPNVDYLASTDLIQMKKAYGNEYQEELIRIIDLYHIEMRKENTIPTKLACIAKTESAIKNCVHHAKNKGFGMHLLKKFYFDAQQQLQQLINPALMPIYLNQAFTAALKLDRVSEFNTVIKEALYQNKLTDVRFINFLNTCIQKEMNATNYLEAQQESAALLLEIQNILGYLKLPAVSLMMQLQDQSSDQNDSEATGFFSDELIIHYDLLAKQETEHIDEPAISMQEHDKEGITVTNLHM